MRMMKTWQKMTGSAALALVLLGGAVAPALAGERPSVVAQARTGEIELVGTLDAVNGRTYTVAGRRVVMARTAEIQAGLVVGDTVKVHATNRAGVLVGREIERVVAPAAPAAPTAAPTAAPIPTNDDHGRGRGNDDGAGDDRGRGRGNDDGAGDDRGRGRGNDDGAGDDRGRGRGRSRG